MPTVAQTAKEKRLFSELLNDGDVKSKKQRVRFDDDVDVIAENDYELDDANEEEEEEEEVEFVLSIGEGGDFDYTIITSSAKESSSASSTASNQPSQEDSKKSLSPKQQKIKNRPGSPFAGSDRRLCEELYMPPSFSAVDEDCCGCCDGIFDTMMLPPLNNKSPSRSSMTWQSSLGNDLKICIPRSSSSDEDETTVESGARSPSHHDGDSAALLTPLITPPSSPRKDSFCSSDGGVSTEETVICEWPCNLTVDNAITSALELPL